MGREVRRVPGNWEHPKNSNGNYIPLFDGFNKRFKEWNEHNEMWNKGFIEKFSIENFRIGKVEYITKEEHDAENEKYKSTNYQNYAEYAGECPDKNDYMPDFPVDERTHYQMYETCSEGTPISPVMETPEGLAKWLEINEASFFGRTKTSYEHWLKIIKGDEPGIFSIVVE